MVRGGRVEREEDTTFDAYGQEPGPNLNPALVPGSGVPGSCICVIGTSGAGKTYVAEALSRRLGLRYVCDDTLVWRANWQPVPREERLLAFDAATREPGWVCDGNLGASVEDRLLLERCDTIVWLDLPRREVHWQVLVRTIRRALTREPLWHGNVESWRIFFSRDSIVWWSIKTYPSRKQTYAALFADPALADRTRIRLRSKREVDAWLASLSERQAQADS